MSLLNLTIRNRFSPGTLSRPNNLIPLVLLLLLLHLVLWSGLAGISHNSPAWDNMEELVWSDSLEWGYYKHPPLPSWIMHGMISLFGQSAWLTFITGQLSVVFALFFIWKLGCEFSFHPAARTKQKSYSLVAMLLTSTIFYFTVQGVMPNHNTMQLWSIAGAIWMFYRAIRHQRLSDWAWLGMFSGFAMLTKYSALIQFFCFFVYLFSAGKLKQKATWQGIAVAILIFLLLVAPHIFWLSQQGSSGSNPLSYANHSLNKDFTRLEHLINIRRFLFNSIGRIAPFLIALSLLIFWNKKGSDPQASSQSVPAAQLKSTETILSHLASSDRLFLLIIGIGPLAFTLLFALIFKMPLNASWASTFFLLFGFFSWGILSEFGPLLRRTIVIVIILQMISSIGFAAVRGPIAQQVGRATRSIYPSKEVSNQFLSIWTHYNETPLTLIAGDTWTAGAIAIHAPHKIQILIDGDYTRSPWIRNTDIRCGMLVVVDHTVGSEPVPAGLIDLRNLSSHKGHLTIPWTNKSNGPQVEVDWGVIPAKKNCLK